MAELFEKAVIVFESVAVAVLIFGSLFCLGRSIRQLFRGSTANKIQVTAMADIKCLS